MNDWEAEWNRDVLERIVALLFALAGLADIAAGLPVLRRRHVLTILAGGEAEARAFVIGDRAPGREDGTGSAGDAMRLAARLRALALMLCVMLAWRLDLPGTTVPRSGRPSPTRPAGSPARLPVPDTS